jgi:Tfp pilus assembly protein FimT
MAPLTCRRGYTLVDQAVMLLLIGVVLGITGPLSRRAIARYQLNAAVHELAADLAQAKMRAIQSNAVAAVIRESDRDYRVAGSARHLPGMVRFDDTSADTVSFNGLGAVTDGTSKRFILVNSLGASQEIRIYAAGGQEVRKP